VSILVDKETKILVQGITGRQGSFHTERMLEYGSKVVGGVTPGKAGTSVCGVPVFDTVREGVERTGADASVIFVPPAFAADAICEASDAGIRLCVCITEGIPVLQLARVKRYLSGKPTRLVGPNCCGVITPDACKIGILPGNICLKGHVGVISRSGTLTYEAISQLTALGIGQSTAVGIGGDSMRGTSFLDALELFDQDTDTSAVVMIGEIGGSEEERAAEWIKKHPQKPVAAFIGGACAPAGKRMGHAGAIVSGGFGTAQGKIAALRGAGVIVADTPDQIGMALLNALKRAGIYEKCHTR
jgi:succinyl-CoA synthetase alpha subunit